MLNEYSTINKLLKINNFLNIISKQPKDFGTKDLLYGSEIHTIISIKHNPNINLTDLSSSLGVTKSATSKFITKLLKKEYIIKTKSVNNKKEVLFKLTPKGEIAAEGHEKYSKNIFETLYTNLDNLPEENLNVINKFLDDTCTILNKIQTTKCEKSEQ